MNTRAFHARANLMKNFLLVVSLTLASASADAQSAPKDIARPATKGSAARVDSCAPIGRTATGELVYSMKCENLPSPASPPQARIEESTTPPPAQPEAQRSGLFGWSFDRRQPEQ
jgi:hypothetical protein